MRKITLLLILSLFLFGCTERQIELEEQEVEMVASVICQDNYMQVGDDCCLDQNHNKRCDIVEKTVIVPADEIKPVPKPKVVEEPTEPFVLENGCNIEQGIKCIDYTLSKTEIVLMLKSNLQVEIKELSVRLGEFRCEGSSILGPGFDQPYRCKGEFPRGELNSKILLEYTSVATGNTYTKSGTLVEEII